MDKACNNINDINLNNNNLNMGNDYKDKYEKIKIENDNLKKQIKELNI